MFARPRDMEPGMEFRTFNNGPVLTWRGVESVSSRFPGRDRVRVLVDKRRGGVDFVCDATASFQVVTWH